MTKPDVVWKIVVGVDDSEDATAALEWAWEEARVRAARLRVVTAWQYPALTMLPGPNDPPCPADVAEEALEEARRVVRKVEAEHGPVDCAVAAVQGHPGTVLVSESATADLMVVGARGRGAVRGLLLGSVSEHCVRHAHCPVVVVRPGDKR